MTPPRTPSRIPPRAPVPVADDEGIGAGHLSTPARARLARTPEPPLRPPAIDDGPAVATWRDAIHRAWLDGDPLPEACGHDPDTIAGVRVLRTAPVDQGPTVLYLHGGGYALGSPEVAVPITERLAASGAEVVSVDYRLAPENPCPAGIEDAVAVARALARSGGHRSIVLAGDSAGANLALSAALRLGNGQDGTGPAGLLLLSPHVDHEVSGSATDGDHRRSDVDRTAADWLAAAYRGGLRPDDPRLSPLRADLSGLAPMLIQVGTADTSLEQAVGLARRARVAGVDVTLDVWHGLWHTWHYHRDVPEADRALAEAGAFAHRLWGRDA